MYLQHYLKQLNYKNIPSFLTKYFYAPTLVRLKNVGYFCGMDYASKDIYDFREYISRFDHSLTVALTVYMLTKDKIQTLAALIHDIATPCFSHVIDYMNKDFEKQESTEEYTEQILKSDKYLIGCLQRDGIDINDVINFKRYSIVDNDRPKLCADRLDGIILTGIGWTKNITKNDINDIVNGMSIFVNEDSEQEIGFKSQKAVKKVLEVNSSIDAYCHSNEDSYMMLLLARITEYAIRKKYITYEQLYTYNEENLFSILKSQKDPILEQLINEFETKKKSDIPKLEMPKIKARVINPIVNGKRIL